MSKSDRKDRGDAYNRALALLVRREHSARELKSKLAQRGLDVDESAAALAKLQSKDFQSDARFGEMLVRTRLEGGYGARWIVAELRTHGIDESRAHALIEEARPDWPDLIRRQLRRRYGTKRSKDFVERNKRAAFLLRRGFDAAAVKLVIDESGMAESVDEVD
ncbi:MAG TPA: regulatory protein RecX [Rudaea sp.]|jgi:regulatory protein|uniref:regulatory protein RecX n=1 Tax=Rudaea sp. TaxID=2136325 RepID=UPI002F936F9C